MNNSSEVSIPPRPGKWGDYKGCRPNYDKTLLKDPETVKTRVEDYAFERLGFTHVCQNRTRKILDLPSVDRAWKIGKVEKVRNREGDSEDSMSADILPPWCLCTCEGIMKGEKEKERKRFMREGLSVPGSGSGETGKIPTGVSEA
ncbi:hypothetical protein TREMEDRAFT_58402 [Tremella mesenterica DSM 1558]|uniref:uncharacterized protein n=1 Tax=Tremella mesenterica (strain ATCC 24925 / CBS 8224 / DSM 1558 / NBRC 9311 / NRRL Y-6157 / RJB 2259-6 / UBC 559-6) TaxID=578456 RepID=UPI0003F48DDE|nr:uncharacterized protein TREMEDRAFT_58402 [Tremella mesenterica DSM 1558]EIW72242.1 hypothetical protein TREMEDRAFT_58402 [Tremella mesenterica DSM 1558]